MGYKLKTVSVGDGIFMQEVACEHYRCRSCGAKMISVNFVNGLCIQVFVTHKAGCEFYTGDPGERTVDVTCETCQFYSDETGCAYEGERNARIDAVRPEAV